MGCAAGKGLRVGGLHEREEMLGRFFGPSKGGPPGLPPTKVVLTQGVACGFLGRAVDGGVEESIPGEGAPKIYAGACPLCLVGFCRDGL